MPSLREVEHEVELLYQNGDQSSPDTVRTKYLSELEKYTGRNVIAYYSGFTEPVCPPNPNFAINDFDKHAFMVVMRDIDRSKGLDLILHTPGGDIAATESLVYYLREMFGTDIRAVIPQIAMSAGTMIACACKQIVMGKHSNLGPIDPQFNGVAAQAVLDEFDEAVAMVEKNPSSLGLWQAVIGKYHPTFLGECRRAIKWSREMVRTWMAEGMFADHNNARGMASKVVSKLGDHSKTKTHSRHLHSDYCKEIGLNIFQLEDDPELQDKVLSVHHAFTYSMALTGFIKIVENQNGLRKGVRTLQQGPPQ